MTKTDSPWTQFQIPPQASALPVLLPSHIDTTKNIARITTYNPLIKHTNMKNYLQYRVQLILWLCLSCIVFSTVNLAAETNTASAKSLSSVSGKAVNPPVFSDPTPDDITISCLTDLPPKVSLMATDDTDPSFPKAIEAVDSPDSSAIDICTGGVIIRTWTATDMDDNTTTVSQTITIS